MACQSSLAITTATSGGAAVRPPAHRPPFKPNRPITSRLLHFRKFRHEFRRTSTRITPCGDVVPLRVVVRIAARRRFQCAARHRLANVSIGSIGAIMPNIDHVRHALILGLAISGAAVLVVLPSGGVAQIGYGGFYGANFGGSPMHPQLRILHGRLSTPVTMPRCRTGTTRPASAMSRAKGHALFRPKHRHRVQPFACGFATAATSCCHGRRPTRRTPSVPRLALRRDFRLSYRPRTERCDRR